MEIYNMNYVDNIIMDCTLVQKDIHMLNLFLNKTIDKLTYTEARDYLFYFYDTDIEQELNICKNKEDIKIFLNNVISDALEYLWKKIKDIISFFSNLFKKLYNSIVTDSKKIKAIREEAIKLDREIVINNINNKSINTLDFNYLSKITDNFIKSFNLKLLDKNEVTSIIENKIDKNIKSLKSFIDIIEEIEGIVTQDLKIEFNIKDKYKTDSLVNLNYDYDNFFNFVKKQLSDQIVNIISKFDNKYNELDIIEKQVEKIIKGKNLDYDIYKKQLDNLLIYTQFINKWLFTLLTTGKVIINETHNVLVQITRKEK